MRKRYTEEQIIAILNESRAGVKTGELVRATGSAGRRSTGGGRSTARCRSMKRSGCGSWKKRTAD